MEPKRRTSQLIGNMIGLVLQYSYPSISASDRYLTITVGEEADKDLKLAPGTYKG